MHSMQRGMLCTSKPRNHADLEVLAKCAALTLVASFSFHHFRVMMHHLGLTE